MKEEIKDLAWEKLTSRKFHVTLVGYVSATLFFYWGLLPPELWVDFSKWLFAIYVVGNSFEHFANQGIKVGGPPKSQTQRQSQNRTE